MKCPNCKVNLIKAELTTKLPDGIPKSIDHYQCPKCVFNTTPGNKLVEEVYMFVAFDPKTGQESLIAMNDHDIPMPAVTTQAALAEMMLKKFKANKPGCEVRLLRVSNREVLEEIKC